MAPALINKSNASFVAELVHVFGVFDGTENEGRRKNNIKRSFFLLLLLSVLDQIHTPNVVTSRIHSDNKT